MTSEHQDQGRPIPARVHPSGFCKADSNFFSLTTAGDGRIYYTLSSHDIDTHARTYRYDPNTDRVELLFDFGEVTGEAGRKSLPQGKSHTPFYELDGKLYLASHYGFFAVEDEKETLASIPEGYSPYPGGHIISYDIASGKAEDIVRGPRKEGIITMGADGERGRIYGLTWPGGHFLVYDLDSRRLRDLGPVSRDGELGEGDRYFCLCRAFAVYQRNGSVFFTNPDGTVLRYSPDTDRVQPVRGLDMRRDVFGQWDPHRPGHQGYNWRIVIWHEPSALFYGVHPKSGWLFAFDPEKLTIELIQRICCENLRRSGEFEPFRYGYLTLQFGPDNETLYYLSGDPQKQSMDENRFVEWIHLMTYNIRTGDYADHGHLQTEGDLYPTLTQSIAVPGNGRLYSCPWLKKKGAGEKSKAGCDLVSFPDPLAE